MKHRKVLPAVIIAVLLVALMAGAFFLYRSLSGTVESSPMAVEEEKSGEEGGSEEEGSEQSQAPDFTVADGSGSPVNLSDFSGVPVVLNFWASWCSPCKEEMPEFNEAFAEYDGQIQFMMVNLTDGSSETVDSAKTYIEEQGFSFPVFYDTNGEAAAAYGVMSIPTTYFIEKDGSIAAYAAGMLDGEVLKEGIDMILE